VASVSARMVSILALLLAGALVSLALGRVVSPPADLGRCVEGPLEPVAASAASGIGTLCVGPTGVRAVLQAQHLRPEYPYRVQLFYVDSSGGARAPGAATPTGSPRIVDTSDADALGSLWVAEDMSGVYPEQPSVLRLVLLELWRSAGQPTTWWPELDLLARHRVDRFPDDEQPDTVARVNIQIS